MSKIEWVRSTDGAQSFLCYDLDPKTGYPAILKGYRVRKCRELHLRPDKGT